MPAGGLGRSEVCGLGWSDAFLSDDTTLDVTNKMCHCTAKQMKAKSVCHLDGHMDS